MLKSLYLALTPLLLSGAAHAQSIITVTEGQARGVRSGQVEAFKGLPYARPPIGDLRWRAPEPPAKWSGIRDASAPSPVCFQQIVKPWEPYPANFVTDAPVSEDCLYLNVWKPSKAQGKLPVFVYIHGGGFRGGSGSLPIYDGSALAARGAVVVTINYRLAAFGFFAHPDLSREASYGTSGNYAILDQIAALRWVKANISKFGGNPDNITVGGESAGAASVNSLIVSPMAKGLFNKAISMSGPILSGPLPSLAKVEQNGVAVAAEFGGGTLAGLRALSASDLLDATKGSPPGSTGGRPAFGYAPNLDGKVISAGPDSGDAVLQSRVPLLAGYNSAEMIDYSVRTPAQFKAALERRYSTFADRFLALYPHATDAEVAASQILINRDRYMAALVLWGQQRGRPDGQPVYAYLYDHAYPAGPSGKTFGAFHSSALPYIFGTLTDPERKFTAQDRAVSRQMQDYWLAFMRSGKPWSRFGPSSVKVMGLGDKPGMRPAVSSPERLKAFRDFVASGGQIGLI